jgi:tetratricopeptide (TPR) repeat protein
LNQINEAIRDYGMAIQRNFPEASYNRAALYFHVRMYKEAIADFTVATQTMSSNSYDVYLWRGQSYSAIAKYNEAIEDFTIASQIVPTVYEPLLHIATALNALNR